MLDLIQLEDTLPESIEIKQFAFLASASCNLSLLLATSSPWLWSERHATSNSTRGHSNVFCRTTARK
jgi:hypothetical protein